MSNRALWLGIVPCLEDVTGLAEVLDRVAGIIIGHDQSDSSKGVGVVGLHTLVVRKAFGQCGQYF